MVGPGCISGENIWTFPRVSFFASGAGSQLTFEMGKGGGAGISKNVTNVGSQLTSGRNKQKHHLREVTTDLGAGISKNVTNAGSQQTSGQE